MQTLYKLTDKDGYTRRNQTGETKWREGFTLATSGKGELCGPGFVHAYTHPLLAMLLNLIHANICDPLLWECEGKVVRTDHGLKVGCTSLTALRRIPLPEVTMARRVRFAILCAQAVFAGCSQEWDNWADAWLSGQDRTAQAAAWSAAPLDLAALAEKAMA